MITINSILETIGKLPEPVIQIRVSMAIAEQLKLHSAEPDSNVNGSAAFGVPFEIALHYQPAWWSEHYRDRAVIHTDKGDITIPDSFGIRMKLYSERTFEITAPIPAAKERD